MAFNPSKQSTEEPMTSGSLEASIRHLRKVLEEGDSILDASDDIKRIQREPQKALDEIHKEFRVDYPIQAEVVHVNPPDLDPKQPFNNITLFDRMPLGYITKQPKSLEELVTIIQNAADERTMVKAVGTCYAFSDVAFTTGYLVEMNRYLHNCLELDTSVLKDNSNTQALMKMESGTMIQSINEKLWPLDNRDNPSGYRTLLNQTGYQGLSIAGITATGAHGSGLNRPPMGNSVVSMHLVTVDKDYRVKQYWFEPSSGITDPEKFKRTYGAQGLDLIQDDDTFYSSVCNVGGFGVVYSYVIRVEPAYYLKEDRRIHPWEETKKMLPNLFEENMSPRQDGSLHSFEIWINPYPAFNFTTNKWEIQSVVTTYRWAEPPRQNKRPASFTMPAVECELMRLAVINIAKYLPKLVPICLELALKATVEKKPVTMPCTEALDFGAPNMSKVLVSDMGIDASSVDNVIKATDALIKLFQSILQDQNNCLTSPFSLRFTAPASAYIAPQYGRQSCMIEAPILFGTPGAEDTLTRFRDCLREGFSGRPHWGQLNSMDSTRLETLYPDTYAKFVHYYHKYNPRGSNEPGQHATFSNDFTDRVFN